MFSYQKIFNSWIKYYDMNRENERFALLWGGLFPSTQAVKYALGFILWDGPMFCLVDKGFKIFYI